MSVSDVQLLPVDEGVLARLLATAVSDADPAEVMPPVVSQVPGWTPERMAAFRAFHRERRGGIGNRHGEATFAVAVVGSIVGSGRLARTDRPTALATGLWLSRRARGRGVGSAAMGALISEARRTGAEILVATTTPANVAAVAMLRRYGCSLRIDEQANAVHAELLLT
jgi:RimJ/RimL family protein N-acetyltransferase